jgi:hypothetical protein
MREDQAWFLLADVVNFLTTCSLSISKLVLLQGVSQRFVCLDAQEILASRIRTYQGRFSCA